MFCSSCGTECVSAAQFCHQCGHQIITVNTLKEGPSSVDTVKLLEEYFHRGYPYQAIVDLLENLHGVQMHVRTLKRRLKALGLRRKETDYDEDLLCDLIKQEMQGAGSLAGYRYVWRSLRLRYHMNVPRSVVASYMKEIDPEGVKEGRARRLMRSTYTSKGPNFCWNIDSRRLYLLTGAPFMFVCFFFLQASACNQIEPK